MKIQKWFYVALLATALPSTTCLAQDYPKVSTTGDEYWYYVKFLRTGNVLENEGSDKQCKTAVAKISKESSRLWKIVSTGASNEKKYQLVSKARNTIYVNGSNKNSSRFSTNKTATGTNAFQIFYSTNTSYGYDALEIATDSTANIAMNQVGEVKAGQLIGLWNKGDMSNVLKFYSKENMEFDYSMPQISTASDLHYYFIQFQNGKYYLAANGLKNSCIVGTLSGNDRNAILWRVYQIGDKYSFTNKLGQTLYITKNSSPKTINVENDKSSADSLFYIVKSSNTLGGFEIGTATSGQNFFNIYQGNKVGNKISVWNLGDNGNVVRFIPESDIVSVISIASYTPKNKYTLWYTQPAENWMTSCLPIGDGQFGATLMGQIAVDDIQFNDKTLWSGKLGARTSSDNYGFYLNFGNLYIMSKGMHSATNYVRYLDINDAIAGVNFTSDGVDYQRSYFASNPDSCIVIRYKASQNGHINAVLRLKNQNGKDSCYNIDNSQQATISFNGTIARQGDSGVTVEPESYVCSARVVIDGGSLKKNSAGLIEVIGANSMIIYLRGLTDYDPDAPQYVSGAALLPTRVAAIVQKAQKKGYETLLAAHKADYKQWFDRCQLTLSNAKNNIPTPTLIANYKNDPKANLFLEELYFSYGRYLLISSSRGVSLPANLQGIWNNNNTPAWHADIHSNINVQMNYWPAEPTNLSELHMPFLNYIYREACVKPTWRQYAKDMGGVNAGWTLPTENNIYGSGTTFAPTYTIANAWYCQHLWQHYQYTLDKDYLRRQAFPAMKSCVEYWFQKLVKANDGTYECPDEWSPEHGPTENATAHSQQLVWNLFNNTRKAIAVLGKSVASKEFRNKLNNYLVKVDDGCHTEKNPLDGKTYLREWKYTSQFNNPQKIGIYEYKNHRHISHLMGLYPCDEIGPDINRAIFDAARTSLIARGDDHGTGWSLGHKMNLNARAYLGDHCHNLIKRALQQTWTTSVNEAAGGIYENLWDAHAPYQIDGNFGFTAGIAEMLLQSRFDKLEILPALPTEYWLKGSVSGLRAVGNFTVDITWDNAIAQKITIVSHSGTKCVVKYKGIEKDYRITDSSGRKVKTETVKAGEISFPTLKGGIYTIDRI